MRIVGLSGLAGAGKDTVADMLTGMRWRKIALADPMKHFCRDVFEFSKYQLWGPSEARNAVDPRWGISPRRALQLLGSEWGRTCHEDLWVRYCLRTAKQLLAFGEDGLYDGVVVPDVRFKNELAAIREAGGEVWRIVRPGYDNGLTGAAAAHVSENDIGEGDCDRIILNEGTLVDLATQVERAASTLEAAA